MTILFRIAFVLAAVHQPPIMINDPAKPFVFDVPRAPQCSLPGCFLRPYRSVSRARRFRGRRLIRGLDEGRVKKTPATACDDVLGENRTTDRKAITAKIEQDDGLRRKSFPPRPHQNPFRSVRQVNKYSGRRLLETRSIDSSAYRTQTSRSQFTHKKIKTNVIRRAKS